MIVLGVLKYYRIMIVSFPIDPRSIMTNQVGDIVRKFFEQFERNSNTFAGEPIARQFSNPFLSADPHGVTYAVSANELIESIVKRKAFFTSIGFQWLKIRVLETQNLDDQYSLAKTQATMQFKKSSGETVDVTSYSTYILYMKNTLPMIVFSTTHEDLMKIMKENGLIP
ncbi:MAG TPA: hypothetical protein DCP92_02220 [Nitrospiraceae bacterium]|nr:hypothetical protein [Nitrospiraceae bacterium]